MEDMEDFEISETGDPDPLGVYISPGMRVSKLTPEGVRHYEVMSHFKTTGDVTVIDSGDEAWKLYEELLVSKKPGV